MRGIIQNAAATLFAVMVLYWAAGAYDAALRDPRYFDGWVLCAAMIVQLVLHIRKTLPALPLGRAASWLRAHIYTGYFIIAAFALHTGFSLPDAPLEWIVWGFFILVAVSGTIGAYLSWSIPEKLSYDGEPITFERIPAFRFALAQEVETLAMQSMERTGSLAISDLYVDRLRAFLERPRNVLAHLRGVRRPLQGLCVEIDNLEPVFDTAGKETLRLIRDRVVAKDGLDFQHAHLGLLQIWLFVHIPATYSVIALTIIHILVVYAFSSGVP